MLISQVFFIFHFVKNDGNIRKSSFHCKSLDWGITLHVHNYLGQVVFNFSSRRIERKYFLTVLSVSFIRAHFLSFFRQTFLCIVFLKTHERALFMEKVEAQNAMETTGQNNLQCHDRAFTSGLVFVSNFTKSTTPY